MTGSAVAVPTGLVLPGWVLHTAPFKVLATFVALNTLMYATLAVLKLVPKPDLSRARGRERRTQERSIHPDGTWPPTDETTAVDDLLVSVPDRDRGGQA